MEIYKMKTKLLALAVVIGSIMVSPVRADDEEDQTKGGHGSLRVFINQPATGQQAALTGTFDIKRFITSDDHKSLSAVGVLSVSDGKRTAVTTVALPVVSAEAVNSSEKQSTAEAGTAAAVSSCPILHLVLGPLSLNLLGLNVNLNQVVLDITATPGPGNLLGNLLCNLAGLLNPGGALSGALQNLANALNGLLAALDL